MDLTVIGQKFRDAIGKCGRIEESRYLVIDTDLRQLLENQTDAEALEIQQYLAEWDPGTYANLAQSVLNHADRKGFTPLRYLRKAHNFNRKGATHVPDRAIDRTIQRFIEKAVNF